MGPLSAAGVDQKQEAGFAFHCSTECWDHVNYILYLVCVCIRSGAGRSLPDFVEFVYDHHLSCTELIQFLSTIWCLWAKYAGKIGLFLNNNLS